MTRREKEIEIAAECARIDTAIKLSHYTDSIDHIDDIKDKNLSYDEIAENAFIQGVKWADNNPKSPWINVKDDLPCNHEELLRNDILTKQVLVVSKDKEDNSIRVCTNYMLKVGIFSQPTNEYRWSGEFYNEVTHWMPLPEPPKE